MNVRPGNILYHWPVGACEDAVRFESYDQLGNDSYDVIIVGAGVAGCALAYQLSFSNVSVLVLDKRHDVGAGTSKANSAIIHTGFDDKPGTLSSELVTSASRAWPELAQRLKIPLLPIGDCFLLLTISRNVNLTRSIPAHLPTVSMTSKGCRLLKFRRSSPE